MDESLFIKHAKPVFGGRIGASQKKAIGAILSTWEGAPITHVAYALATVLAECGANMLPVREGFFKTDAESRAYVKKKYWTMKSGKPGYGRPAGPFEVVYYGRGYVQLTWYANYERASKELGINFARDPDLALVPANASLIMRRGMEQGWFTGKKLSDYLDKKVPDYLNARRIINGTDRAREIAGYAMQFEIALRVAGWGKAAVAPIATVAPSPSPQPATEFVTPETPWWEKSPIIRQAVNTFSALGIGVSTILGMDKSVVIALVVGIVIVSTFAIYTHSRKAKP